MSEPTRWWWVRHAPVPGAPSRIYGQSDVSCDTSETAAFANLAASLPEGAVWVVSPLKRTHETLDAIASIGVPIPQPIIEPGLAEQDFGRWQGLSWAEMQANDPAAYAAFWQDPTRAAPPDGESYVALMDRARTAIERLTAAHAGRDMIAVSHGGTIRAAVGLALNLTPEATMAVVIDNLSVTRLSHVEDGLLRGRGGVWMVEGVNWPSRGGR